MAYKFEYKSYTEIIYMLFSFSDVDNMDDKSAVKLDGKTFLKFTNKMNKM